MAFSITFKNGRRNKVGYWYPRHSNGTYVRVKKGDNYLKMSDSPGQLLREAEVKLSEDLLKETAILHMSHIIMPYFSCSFGSDIKF